jgi:hypothetical protein
MGMGMGGGPAATAPGHGTSETRRVPHEHESERHTAVPTQADESPVLAPVPPHAPVPALARARARARALARAPTPVFLASPRLRVMTVPLRPCWHLRACAQGATVYDVSALLCVREGGYDHARRWRRPGGPRPRDPDVRTLTPAARPSRAPTTATWPAWPRASACPTATTALP